MTGSKILRHLNGAVRLFGIFFVFGVLSAQAQTGAQNSITALGVSSAGGGATVIKVELSQPLANPPAAFTINTPPRIAFDFPNTANGLGKSVQDFTEGDLRSANIVQAGGRTRLVINLSQMLTYDTKVDGNSLLITLHAKPADMAATTRISRFAEANRDVQKHNLRDIDFHRGKNGEGRIQVDLSDSGIGIDIRQQGTVLIVDFLKTSLPQNLQRKLDVIDFATPVQGVDTFAQGDNVRIVISDTVTGNLTLRLKDVPWDQAFDIILQSRGLDMRKNGNVIQVAPRDEIAAKEKIDLSSRQEIADLEEIRTESFQLNYIKADSFKKILTDDKQKILSKRGSAVCDERTNILFIQDTPTSLDGVRKLIKQVDVPVRQVMIEARVVEASDTFSRNLGVRLNYNATDSFSVGKYVGQIGANVPPATSPLGLAGVTANVNTPNVNLPSAGTAGAFSMLLLNQSLSRMLSVELTALETDSKGKIISSPRVVTADKTEAMIETGTEVPYQQASSSGATNVAFKKATLSLSVKPQITPDDNVIMDIKVNKDSVGTLYAGVPSIDTSKVNTQVLVENGGTVVIGGVYTQVASDGVDKVPLLGDIPVLGYLFRRSAKIDNKNELLIFITPRI